MAGEAEAGDVGQGVHGFHLGQRFARRVEPGGPLHHARIAFCGELALLQRRREDADAERLAQNQRIPRFGGTVFLHLVGMNQPERDQAVDRLEHVDRMPAGDRDARLRAHRLAAFENAADHRHRQLLERHADDGEREDRPRAHRVDVGERIGGRDAPEVVRIINDRREEISGGDERLAVVQAVDRRIVGGLGADEQLLRQSADRRRSENFSQHRGRDLAAAAAAVAELGQANLLGSIHGV